MPKITILCFNELLYNSSGINTFITYLKNLMNKLDIDYKVINEIDDDIDFVMKSDIIISNDYFSLKDMVSFDKYKDKVKLVFYTHIGDMIHDKEEFYDFTKELKDESIVLLNNNSNVIIATQTNSLKKELMTIFKNDIIVLPEPFTKNDNEFTKISNSNKTAITIMSNSKRKRIDRVFEVCSKNNLDLILITGCKKGYYDIPFLINKYNVNTKIFINVPNEFVQMYSSMADVMLFFSEIEVLPYSILENYNIPIVINSDALWSSKIDIDGLNYIRDDDHIELSALDKIDINSYINMSFNLWVKFFQL